MGKHDAVFDPKPICAMHANDLRAQAGGIDPASTKQVVNADRDCPSFTHWIEGFSPQEHRRMQFENEQREWRRKQDEQRDTFEAEQVRLADERHRQTMDRAIAGARSNLWAVIVAAFIGVGGALAAVGLGWLLSHR
jgi:hypothetical protein